jgi:hypothetical protein
MLIFVLGFLHCVRIKFPQEFRGAAVYPLTSSGNLPRTAVKNPKTKSQCVSIIRVYTIKTFS